MIPAPVILGPCTLYNADCLEVLPTMAGVDAVVTDPPYGVDLDYGENGYDDSFENWRNLIVRFIPAACRATNGPVIIPTSKFEGEAYLHSLKPIWRLCWFKGAACTRSPVGFKDWEPTFIFNAAPRKQIHDYFTAHANGVRQEITQHPCPKPIKWAYWLVNKMSESGQIVLDPFMGSGTTGIACIRTGRKFIGIEIDKTYFDIACDRIRRELQQTTLSL